jgi:SpoVK/Ycf46/Vps4 family AAA+-type ATPase
MDKVKILREMVEGNPGNAPAWYLLGLEYLEQGMLSEALGAFSEALKSSDPELKAKVFTQLATLTGGIPGKSMPGEQQQETEPVEKTQDITVGESVRSAQPDESDEEGEESEDEACCEGDSCHAKVPLRVISGGKKDNIVSIEDAKPAAIDFSNVGGLEDLKETIRMKIIKPFTNPGLFSKFKKKSGGGLLLFGPPGCGKTFIARATAGECQARFMTVHITDILDPYLGVSEQNLRDIFSTARASTPCVLFFDEIDAIGFNRAKSSSNLMRPVVDQLLAEMEGIDTSTQKLLIIGATNMPWDVDPAFKRPGRFDKLIFVSPPDLQAREAIFGLKLADKPSENISLVELAKQTELYSGADIENVVEIATENVIAEIMKTGVERPIQMRDLMEVVKSTKPSTVEWLRTIKNYVKYANQGGLYDEVQGYLAKHKTV